MIWMTRRAHDRLSDLMHKGDRSYQGASQREGLRNSFSSSTVFPGAFAIQVLISLVACMLALFVILQVILTPIVLLVLKSTRHIITDAFMQYLLPLILVFAVKWLIKVLIVDNLLVDHGKPVRP